METRTCRVCGKAFETELYNKGCCSPDCAKKWRSLLNSARRRAAAARKAEVRRAEKAEREAAKEKRRREKREAAVRKWGGVERYEAHLADARRYRELRRAGTPTRRESIERARSAGGEDEPAGTPSAVCQVCGRPLTRIQLLHRYRFCSKSCAALAREEAWRRDGIKPAPKAAAPAVHVCSVCGAELGDAGGDLCCLCSRAVDRDNALLAASSPAPWLLLKTRRCHDCGRPCNGYRCPRCLRKWRKRHDVNVGDYDGRA